MYIGYYCTPGHGSLGSLCLLISLPGQAQSSKTLVSSTYCVYSTCSSIWLIMFFTSLGDLTALHVYSM